MAQVVEQTLSSISSTIKKKKKTNKKQYSGHYIARTKSTMGYCGHMELCEYGIYT
jgi:hypothetical protein